MKSIASCNDFASLVTFGSSDPASIAAFGGQPFYVTLTTGAMWVSAGGAFYKVEF